MNSGWMNPAMKSCCVGGRECGRAGGNQRLAEDGQIANDFIVEISGRQTDRQADRHGWKEGREDREGGCTMTFPSQLVRTRVGRRMFSARRVGSRRRIWPNTRNINQCRPLSRALPCLMQICTALTLGRGEISA